MGAVRIQKVYVSQDNERSVIECPHCGMGKTRHAREFKGSKRRLRVTCGCQSTFGVLFEFRKVSRKQTHLVGQYAKLPATEKPDKMLVTNISVAGIGFDAVNSHDLVKGDTVSVSFTVDDMWMKPNGKGTEVERRAVVRWVKDEHIGCEFMVRVGYDTVDAISGYYLVP